MIPGTRPRTSSMAKMSFVGSFAEGASDKIFSVDIPGFAQRGDFCVVDSLNFSDSGGSGTGTLITPPGFKLIGSVGGDNTRWAVWGKILDGSESSVPGMTQYALGYMSVAIFRASRTLNGFTVHNASIVIATGNPSARTISPSGVSKYPAMAFGMMRTITGGGGNISPRLSSPAMTEHSFFVGTSLVYMHYALYGAYEALDTYSYDMDDEGFDNYLLGSYISFT